jgi:hypothetical protein
MLTVKACKAGFNLFCKTYVENVIRITLIVCYDFCVLRVLQRVSNVAEVELEPEPPGAAST